MLRKLVVLVIVLAIGGGVCSGSSPSRNRAGERAAAAHRPISTTARPCSDAGGCASCHATPEQDDKTRLGGGLGAEVAVRHVLCAEHLARSEGRHRRAGARRDFVTAMLKGTSPDGRASTFRRFPTRPISA